MEPSDRVLDRLPNFRKRMDWFLRYRKDMLVGITYMEREEVRDAWERGQGRGRVSLRRIQYQLAEKGNAPMAIFLGKNLLGQRDRFDTEEEGDPTKDAARRIKGALDAIESAVVDTDKDEE